MYLTRIETIGKCLFEMHLSQFVNLFIYLYIYIYIYLRVPCESFTKGWIRCSQTNNKSKTFGFARLHEHFGAIEVDNSSIGISH